MSLLDRDLLMRQLRFLQQLLRRALKAQTGQDFAGALGIIRDGYREALGVPHEMLARVDVSSALLLLRTPERRTAYVELLRAEADALRAQGQENAASALVRRADQVERAAS